MKKELHIALFILMLGMTGIAKLHAENGSRSLPTVTTADVTIVDNNIISGGNVIDEGDSPVTARGICYGSLPSPDLTSTYTHTEDGAGGGIFTSLIDASVSGTIYVRAYATNNDGTAYGNQITVDVDYLRLPTFFYNDRTYKVAPDPQPSYSQYFRYALAESYCENLVAYGYSDWRLPTITELESMYINRESIGGFVQGNNNHTILYWSSSNYGSNHYLINWSSGLRENYSGYDNNGYYSIYYCHVRPIRVETNTITVSSNPSNGGSVSGGGDYQQGQSCTVQATANTGYTFTNWTENGIVVSTNASYTFTVSANRTLVANFSAQSYTISVSASPNNGGTVSGGGTFNYGQSCTVTATPASNYTFVKWTKNGTQVSTNATHTFNVTESATYVAHFASTVYTILATANPSNGGTVTVNGREREMYTYDFDDSTTQGWTSIDADGDGYNWMLGSVAMGTGYGHGGSTDMILSKSYDNSVGALNPDNYIVSPLVQLGGSISFWACAQDAGFSSEHFGVAVSTTNNTSASAFTTIQEWTMTSKGIGAPTEYTRCGNRDQGIWYHFIVNLSAYNGMGYVAIRHFNCTDMFYLDVDDITIMDAGSGMGTFNYGQTCTVTATPNTGYNFTNWTENGVVVSTNANYTFTVSADRTLVANFSAQSYTISISANPSNGGSVSGGGTFNHGQSCTLIATPASNYTFLKWTRNGVQVSTNATYTFNVTESATYVAHFAAYVYTITATANPTYGGTVTVGGRETHNYDFDDGSMQGWTTIDADGDGFDWATNTSFGGHNGSTGMVCSQSYHNSYGALTPDNFLVSPLINLGGSISFWACAQDASWPTEHFGVAVSTTNNSNANAFTTIQEWTIQAKQAGIPTNMTREGDLRSQSQWYQYTIDLGAFIGQTGYVAIRHFNCTDMFYLDVDDITILDAGSSIGTFNNGQTCTVTATPNTGYCFINWTENGTVVSTNANYTFTVNANRTLVANFLAQNYTISVSASPSNGGTVTGGGTYQQGQSCTVQATANTGYTFTNWTENGTVVSTNANYTFTVTGNRTLVAHFSTSAYAITATANPTNGGTVTGAGNYEHGASCTLTAIANEGYTFVKWTKNDTQVSTNASYTFDVTSSAAYVAHFSLNSYTITATANPSGGGTVSGGGTFNYCQTCTVTATANNGYTFTSWTENGTLASTNASYTFVVTGNRTLVANFSTNAYTITATANPTNGGTVTGAGNYDHGASCTLTAIANEGYTFVKWTKNGTQVSTNASYTFNVTSSAAYVAHFSLNSYTITATANPSAGGTVSGGGTFNYGQTCTVTAIASNGYTFTNWTENGNMVSANANYTFAVTGNRTLVANFSTNTFNISATANPTNGGTVNGSGIYGQGQSCTLTATANNGYSFSNWTENGTTVWTSANYTFTVTDNRTLVANFSTNTYTITVTANPTNGGTVSGGGNFEYGATCSLTATANEGYTFVKWTKDNTQVSTSPNYSFSVTENATYMAHFNSGLNEYTITAYADPENGGTIFGTGIYTEGSTCELKAVPNANYVFENWTRNGIEVSTSPDYSFPVNRDISLVAHFNKIDNNYTIAVNVEPSDAGAVEGEGLFEEGATCTLTAIPNPTYSFVSWTENGIVVSTENPYSFTVDRDRNLVAVFAQGDFYTISASASPNGTISPEGVVVVSPGEDKTFTITPDNNCRVSKVLVDGLDVGPVETYTFRSVNSNHSIHVQFSGLGVEDNDRYVLNIYPNPTNNIIHIESPNMKQVSMFNLLGVNIGIYDVNDDHAIIGTDKLSQGTYILKVEYNDGHVGYSKFVVAK